MSTRSSPYQHCVENERRIEQYMPSERWKAIKSAFYATLAVGFATGLAVMGAEPTAALMMGGFLLLVFYGVELREVEIAKWVSIRFRVPDRRTDEEDDTER